MNSRFVSNSIIFIGKTIKVAETMPRRCFWYYKDDYTLSQSFHNYLLMELLIYLLV